MTSLSPAFQMLVTSKGEPFTYGGRILVHESREELGYLFPNNRTAPYRGSEGDAMLLIDHPDMAAVRFPLNRKDFRHGR